VRSGHGHQTESGSDAFLRSANERFTPPSGIPTSAGSGWLRSTDRPDRCAPADGPRNVPEHPIGRECARLRIPGL